MTVSGELLIGSTSKRGVAGAFKGFDPSLGAAIEPDFGGATPEDLDRACALAEAAFNTFRETTLEQRAQFLEAIAENLLADGDRKSTRLNSSH